MAGVEPGDTERVAGRIPRNYDRLVERKTEWDADSLFRMTPNVDPAGGA